MCTELCQSAMAAPMVTDSKVLADHVFEQLGGFLMDQEMPTSELRTEELRLRHRKVIMAWYWTIMYYSKQGSAVTPVLTDQAALQELVVLPAETQLSQETWTEGSVPIRLALDLSDLLARPPDTTERAQCSRP